LALGLLSELPCKNCWTIAEWAGEATPDGMRHLLSRAERDADPVRDDVRQYVVEHLHDPEAVLVVDETGDVKKRHRHRRGQRQYTGTASLRGTTPDTALRTAHRHVRGKPDGPIPSPLVGWSSTTGSGGETAAGHGLSGP
jgi:hypothetical protein